MQSSIDKSGNGNGSSAPVLAGSGFLKVKLKFHFYKKQVHMSASRVIIELQCSSRLIALSYNRSQQKKHIRGTRLSAAHTLCLQGILLQSHIARPLFLLLYFDFSFLSKCKRRKAVWLILLCIKLSNKYKQSGRMTFRPVRLITLQHN